MRRRLFTILSTLALVLCVLLTIASSQGLIVLTWKAHAAGVNRGVAFVSRIHPSFQSLALIHDEADRFPGASVIGFTSLSFDAGKIIVVPLWFLSLLSLVALLISLRSQRRQRHPIGFPIEAKILAASDGSTIAPK